MLRRLRVRRAFQKERTIVTKARKWDVKEIREYLKLFINSGLNIKRIC